MKRLRPPNQSDYNLATIEEKLALVEDKLSILKTGDLADELKKQSAKRTKTAIAFLLIVVADWSMSYAIPILQGRSPLTAEAIMVSFILLFFYMGFISIGKLHQWLDIRTLISWLDLSSKVNSSTLNDIKAKEMADLDVEKRKTQLKLRDDAIREMVSVGSGLFIGENIPSQRSDWTPMTQAFVSTLRQVDDQLLQHEMQTEALIILEDKLPAIKESLKVLVKHMEELERREKKRDKVLQKINSEVDGLKSKVNIIERKLS